MKDHVFLMYELASNLWQKIFRWVDMVLRGMDIVHDLCNCVDPDIFFRKSEDNFHSIVDTILWMI